MKTINELKKMKKIVIEQSGIDGCCGYLFYPSVRYELRFVASFGLGWDHVSVSYKNRIPTWNEINYVKDIFFHDDETVVQFHPKKSEYINNHPYTLHLWKPQDYEIQLPPNMLI